MLLTEMGIYQGRGVGSSDCPSQTAVSLGSGVEEGDIIVCVSSYVTSKSAFSSLSPYSLQKSVIERKEKGKCF